MSCCNKMWFWIFAAPLLVALGVFGQGTFAGGGGGTIARYGVTNSFIEGGGGTVHRPGQGLRGITSTVNVSTASGEEEPASSLLTDLVGYWKMDEATGNRTDSSDSGHDLTEINSVTNVTGKVGSAAQFVRGNDERLEVADNAELSMGAEVSHTVTAWIYMDSSMAGTPIIAGKLDAGVVQWGYGIFLNGSDQYAGVTIGSAPGGPGQNLTDDGFGALSTATWYLIVGGYDAVNNLQFICVNDGTVKTTAWAAGGNDDTEDFAIGSFSSSDGADNNHYFDGRIDEVGVWKKVLSAEEITALYNAGSGVTYPTFAFSSPENLMKFVRQLAGYKPKKKHHADVNMRYL